MTTHRRYYFEVKRADGHDEVKRILLRNCESYWWFNEPEVSGQEFGVLAFSFTVSARDQWFTHQRAMDLAQRCFRSIGIGPKGMPEPVWEPLAPHTNRGRFRVPRT
jgi:hypothetical protein